MNPFNKYLSFILLSLIFSACCAVPNIYKLTSEEPEADYLMGAEIITKEIRSVVLSLNFEEQAANEFYLYLLITNNAINPIVFSPEKVFMEVFDESMKFISPYLDTVYAYDPEMKILSLNSDLISRTNQHNFVTGMNTVFGLLSIAADIAAGPSDTKFERVTDDVMIWSENQLNENINFESKMTAIENLKKFWKDEALRKTTLYYNDKIGGLIAIPVIQNAKFIKLHIILGERDFTFLYKQVKIKPKLSQNYFSHF